jgi:CheY-like chemotaxis protein
MRPAKVVLLAGADERRQSLRRFLLTTWGYSVATAATAEEALTLLRTKPQRRQRQFLTARDLARSGDEVDLLIVDLPLPGFDAKVLTEAKGLCPWLRTMLTSNHVFEAYDAYGADVTLARGGDSPAVLLERVKILVARKRGPRPGWKLPVGAVRAIEHSLKKGAA